MCVSVYSWKFVLTVFCFLLCNAVRCCNFIGVSQSARSSPCRCPFTVFSASSPKQSAPQSPAHHYTSPSPHSVPNSLPASVLLLFSHLNNWPSSPLLTSTPLPPLPPPLFLSSGHPGTSVLSCTTLPHLPPSPLAVITWCLNSSLLNSATFTLLKKAAKKTIFYGIVSV